MFYINLIFFHLSVSTADTRIVDIKTVLFIAYLQCKSFMMSPFQHILKYVKGGATRHNVM